MPIYIVNITINPGLAADPAHRPIDADPASVLGLLLPSAGGGAAVEVPLRFVLRGSGYFVAAPAQPLPSWARSLQSSPQVRWRIGGRVLSGTAAPMPPGSDSVAAVLSELEARHGSNRVRRWFGPEPVVFELRASDARADETLQAHFDRLAPVYDRQVRANPLDRALREVTVATLLRRFHRGDRVLEIGCGTGLETLPLARAGIEVVAVDASPAMLDRLREKARGEGLSGSIELRRLQAREIGSLTAVYADQTFQGAFSDFGPPNLEPEWTGIPGILARLIQSQGALVLTVWNRTCLVEMGLCALRLRPRRALARLRSPVPVGLSRFGFPAYARSPGPFLRPFRPYFRLEELTGLPVVVPPYDFFPRVPRPDRVLPLLESADRHVRGLFPLNRLGDHFVAVLRRSRAAPPGPPVREPEIGPNS